MTLDEFKKLKLPDDPGVYRFLDQAGTVLYIGKATSLKDRVRSYFNDDILHTRGKHILDMVLLAHTVSHQTTQSALEALILEAALIKQFQPTYNTREKDDKSFNYVVITNETYPRVLVIRERTMLGGVDEENSPYRHAFGPFPYGGSLQEAVKIIRKILPFRDRCEPNCGKPCFSYQIGLCPGVCVGAISQPDYAKRIQHIKMFFDGKKRMIISELKRRMSAYAKKQEFEDAGECKRMIFSLEHIKDVSLLDADIKEESKQTSRTRRMPFRIEAYDIAHISGKYTVGVMVVLHDGIPVKSEYRKFRIKSGDGANDTLHLEETLRRRFNHPEWRRPDLVAIDGGEAQKRRAQKVLNEIHINIPVVSVVKDDHHKARGILGDKEISTHHKKSIVLANQESHRFAVAYHRKLREKIQ